MGNFLLFGGGDKGMETFSSNFKTINLKIFCNHGGAYGFEKKFKKYFGER